MNNEEQTGSPNPINELAAKTWIKAKEYERIAAGHPDCDCAEPWQAIAEVLRTSADVIEKKDKEIKTLKTNFDQAEKAVDNVLRLLPKTTTNSWEDAVTLWLKESAAKDRKIKALEKLVKEYVS